MTFRHTERDRALARAAYRTFEPYHTVAYFGPHVDATRTTLGIGWLGAYTGMRAAPLGPVPASVVAALFYGFRPSAIEKAWGLALAGHDPAELDRIRLNTVDAGLQAALGELVGAPAAGHQADRMRRVIERADLAGRGLAAAYFAQPWPDEPHLALWQATSWWREWRGDGHNAVLVAHGIGPLAALVLYDAELHGQADRATAGRNRVALQPTRKWTDDEWIGTARALADSGLVTVDGNDITLTEQGFALRRDIEAATDDAAAAVWVGVDDAEELLASFRPFSKAVIDSGILPGTTARTPHRS